MIIFVVNCGSSSIKYQLLNMDGEQVLAKGLIERIGMEGSVLKHTPTGKYTVDISAEIPDHSIGIQMALDALTNYINALGYENAKYDDYDDIASSIPRQSRCTASRPWPRCRHVAYRTRQASRTV